jgi:type IV pilus assembly protein PilE
MDKHMLDVKRSGQKNWPSGSDGLATLQRSSRGFTLIELMVAVVVVGILTSVAVTSYRSSIQKTNRQVAKTALLDLAAREEKYFSLNNAYSSTITDLYPGTSLSWGFSVPLSGTALYTISTPTVTTASTSSTTITPAAFALIAVPTGGQTNDACGSFTLNSVGQQAVTGTGSSCW